MNFRNLLLREQKGDGALVVVFLVVAVILGFVGFYGEDYLYYIRAGIFCVAVLFLWWRKGR
ncbi:hypothetical protein HN903_01305 [archaeon]|nr:hypothetical protein [archaeon]